MVIIVFFGEHFVDDQGLAKCINGLLLLEIPNILDGNRADAAIALPSAALLLQRVFELGRRIERLLLERSDSGPPFVLGVLKIRSPLLLLVAPGETFETCKAEPKRTVSSAKKKT